MGTSSSVSPASIAGLPARKCASGRDAPSTVQLGAATRSGSILSRLLERAIPLVPTPLLPSLGTSDCWPHSDSSSSQYCHIVESLPSAARKYCLDDRVGKRRSQSDVAVPVRIGGLLSVALAGLGSRSIRNR